MDVTKDLFWNEYTDFDNKIGSFDGDKFIWKSKDIRYGNIHLGHQKYTLHCTKVLGVGVAEISWGDIKKNKYGKRSAISSDVSEKHGIVYTYVCIESHRI